MADNAAARLARLARASGDIDVKELLDAVLLAAAWNHADQVPGSLDSGTGDDAVRRPEHDRVGTAAPGKAVRTAGGEEAGDTAAVWLEDQVGARVVRGKRVSVGRATALPGSLDIGRALRPLRRPWPSGVHRRLDVDATVEHYTRTGILVPRLTPAPESWLEVVVVLDRGTAMAVWDETVRTFTKMLRALGAFRDVRVWHLDHPPGDDPVLHDHRGRALPTHPDAAGQIQPARRLLLVVSDCAAAAWRKNVLWRMLHVWGRTAPVALINPLPRRLWQRSGLDLPRVTATATVPASPGRLLCYRRPRLLREAQDTKPWQALPVLQFDPDQILAWARALMRTDPAGCDAVLVPATGRPPLRQRHSDRHILPDTAPTNDQVRARAEAFTDDRQSPAVRLAIAASPLGSFTLPVLGVLRDRLVPEATLADTAEFLTAGLLTVAHWESADTVYHFRPAAATHLTDLLTRDQLWETHFALSDHLAAHVQAPHGIPVVLHSPMAHEALPTGVRPIAYAAATTARLLGVEPTDLPPATRSRPSPAPPAEMLSNPPRATALALPRAPEDSLRAAELYRTLAHHFRLLLARASRGNAVRPSLRGQHETPQAFARAARIVRKLGEPEGHEEAAAVEVPLQAPDSFEELWKRLDNLQGILVTADHKDVLALDRVGMDRRWPEKTWRGLRALDAYGRATRDGFKGGFYQFCQSGSPQAVPPRWLAVSESRTTMRRPGVHRSFPVPKNVAPAGRAEMQMHLKPDSGGGISLRIYFLDDTKGSTGRVIVGYIGPHLAIAKSRLESSASDLSYILKSAHKLDLPRRMKSEFSRIIQARMDTENHEITPNEVWAVFQDEYLPNPDHPWGRIRLKAGQVTTDADGVDTLTIEATVDGEDTILSGTGRGQISALFDALESIDITVGLLDYQEHSMDDGAFVQSASYVECAVGDTVVWGIGIDANTTRASLKAVVSAVNRAVRGTDDPER